VCNNGGAVYETTRASVDRPGADYNGGSIQRIDRDRRDAGALQPVRWPQIVGANDIVFDNKAGSTSPISASGWPVTATMAGSITPCRRLEIVELVYPIITPNGSGCRRTRRPSMSRHRDSRLYAFDIVEPARSSMNRSRRPMAAVSSAAARLQRFDSLAVEASGNICVAT